MESKDPWEQVSNLNEALHAPIRIAILLYLLPKTHAKFSSIQRALNVTAGNLSSHLKKLSGEKFIEIEKVFVEDKPVTIIYITANGIRSIQGYAKILNEAMKSNDSQNDQIDQD